MDTKDMFSYYLTININSICRVCLEKPNLPQKLTPIFDSVKPPHFSNLIMACAAVQVVENDGLPAYLCEECMSQLQIAYEFKMKCETSDLRLRDYLTTSTSCASTTTSQLDLGANNDVITSLPPIKSNSQNVFNVMSTPIVLNMNNTAQNPAVLSLNANGLDTNSLLLNSDASISNESAILSSVIANSNVLNLGSNDPNRSNVNNTSSSFMYKPNFIINIGNTEGVITMPNDTSSGTSTYTNLQQLQPEAAEVLTPQLPQQTTVQHVLAEPDLYINMKKEESTFTETNTPIEPPDQSITSCENSLENEFLILRKNNLNKTINETYTDEISEPKNGLSTYQMNDEKETMFLMEDSDEHVKAEYIPSVEVTSDHFLMASDEEKTVKFKKRPSTKKRTSAKPPLSNIYNPKLPKKHQCDTCGKIFKAKQGLIQHLRIHSGERPYLCHLCNKRFINGGHLHTHMRTHTGEKNHKCGDCVKAFATAQQLHKHVIAIHTQERPYQCTYCPKRCASSSNLTTHIRIHTGEKNYHCDRCPKAFSTKGQLLQHILIHTGQKPFYCDVCQKRFTQRAHLTRHMKMHKQSNANM